MPEPGEAGGIPPPTGRSVEEGGESPQNNSGSVITMGLSTRSPSLGSDGGSDGEIIIRGGYGTAFSSHNLGKEVREELLQEFKKHLDHGTAKEFEGAFFGLDRCQASVRGRTRGTNRVPALAQKDMSTVRVGRRPAAYANEWTSGGRTLREHASHVRS